LTFLNPIDDRLLAHNLMLPEQVIGRNFLIHTPKRRNFQNLTDIRVAMVSLEPTVGQRRTIAFCVFDNNSINFSLEIGILHVLTFGVLHSGDHPKDTLFALKTLVKELHQRNILTIVVGGEQKIHLACLGGSVV